MDVKICDILGFDLYWCFYGGKINGVVAVNQVNIGQFASGRWSGRVLQNLYFSGNSSCDLRKQISEIDHNINDKSIILTNKENIGSPKRVGACGYQDATRWSVPQAKPACRCIILGHLGAHKTNLLVMNKARPSSSHCFNHTCSTKCQRFLY